MNIGYQIEKIWLIDVFLGNYILNSLEVVK
jgi:hypothetical protein